MRLSTGQIVAGVEVLQHVAAEQERAKMTCSACLCSTAPLLNHYVDQ